MNNITVEMAQKGLTTALKILDLWGCSRAQKCAILNIDGDDSKSLQTLHFGPS